MAAVFDRAVAYIPDRRMTAVLNGAIVADIPYCRVAGILDRAIGPDIAGGRMACVFDRLRGGKLHTRNSNSQEKKSFHTQNGLGEG